MGSCGRSSGSTTPSTGASRSRSMVSDNGITKIEVNSRGQELEERAARAEKDNSMLRDQAMCF